MTDMQHDPISDALLQAIGEGLTAGRDGGSPGDPGGPAPAPEDGPPPEAEGAALPLNDYGNGLRVGLYFGRDLFFVPRLGWHCWDGRRWGADEDALQVRKFAQRIAERIMAERFHIEVPAHLERALAHFEPVKEELETLERLKETERDEAQTERLLELRALRRADEEARKQIGKARADHVSFAKSSGNTTRISNMMKEAQPELATDVADLNPNTLDICCENGVIELRLETDAHGTAWGEDGPKATARLVPHDRGQRITKMVAAPYQPDAPRPVFEAFLARVLPDADVRALVKRWFGYCLTGETGEQKLAFLYGHGRNGKSTLVDLLARIVADYGTTLPIESLTGSEQRKGSDATPDLVRLPGARFVRASEPEQGQKMKEALVKALTGGEPILVRRMMQEFVEIQPQFKLTISGNYKPEVRGADDGIWRRIMLIPFTEQIPEDEVDPMLARKLWDERAGIFAWMVEGALEWMQTGLRPPASILDATQEYRKESDPMRLFLQTECEITGDDEDKIAAKFLGQAFNAWMSGNGDDPWRPRTTGMALRKRAETVKSEDGKGFYLVKASTNFYHGIRLTDAARLAADAWVGAGKD
ncbi:hypothetical protein KUV64_22085 [Mameliella alba]|uniref:DNA primase family protein n=1 Tax=Mameliella alba TaxID=561184 RepID=UPI001C93E50B|nr:phage/plasmid primase, P4 family [Mameliella alba]MBY6121828.1 hypothetical protein [Mameliella alba]